MTQAGSAGRALRVAVVGGGYAGMAAAVELASQGIAPSIFEAGEVLGGPPFGGRAQDEHARRDVASALLLRGGGLGAAAGHRGRRQHERGREEEPVHIVKVPKSGLDARAGPGAP